jgi:hypothetical protein
MGIGKLMMCLASRKQTLKITGRTSAYGGDFNRSTQHFGPKSLRSKNVFESTQYLKVRWEYKRLSMEILANLSN